MNQPVFEREPSDPKRKHINPLLKLALELGPLLVFFFANARGEALAERWARSQDAQRTRRMNGLLRRELRRAIGDRPVVAASQSMISVVLSGPMVSLPGRMPCQSKIGTVVPSVVP